jgi:glycosyltransferase involved in cell wall biosynthesis
LLSRFSFFQSSLQKQLISNGVDVVYFMSPNPLAMGINAIPMVNTVWDLGHRELSDYPEMASKFQYLAREFFYSNVLHRSLIVVTDSERTSKSISKFYKVQTGKTISAGLFPTQSLRKESNSGISIISPYIIYPAQFWLHKNHDLLINLMDVCKSEFPSLKLILTGSDKGNLENVRRSIQTKDLKNIEILGFVNSELLTELISNASALVFASKLGPTNLPPLEALALGTPVIVTKNNSDLVHNPTKGVWVIENDSYESFLAALREIIKYDKKIEPWNFTQSNLAAAKGIIDLINSEYLKINLQIETKSVEQSFHRK